MNSKLKQNLSALSLSLCLGSLIGCTSTATTSSKPATTTETKTAETKPVEKTTTDNKSGLTTSSDDKIGVLECDNYLEKYEACVTAKVPESSRQAILSSFKQTRQTWKGLAANPNTKASLAATCKQSLEMTKQAMSQYSCEW